jgi:hypothetical protein
MSHVLTNVCVTNNNSVRLYSVQRGEKKILGSHMARSSNAEYPNAIYW